MCVVIGASVIVGVGTAIGAVVGTTIGALVVFVGTGALVGVDVDGSVGPGIRTGLAVGACVDVGDFVVLLCMVGSAVGAMEVAGGGGGTGFTSGLLGDSVGITAGMNVGAFVLIGAVVGDNVEPIR